MLHACEIINLREAVRRKKEIASESAIYILLLFLKFIFSVFAVFYDYVLKWIRCLFAHTRLIDCIDSRRAPAPSAGRYKLMINWHVWTDAFELRINSVSAA